VKGVKRNIAFLGTGRSRGIQLSAITHNSVDN
jgi:hypothetical protein